MKVGINGLMVLCFWLLYGPLALILWYQTSTNYLHLVVLLSIGILFSVCTLVGTVVYQNWKKRKQRREYHVIIQDKMNILAQLQEELIEEEAVTEKDYIAPPQPPLSEAHLPANFFDTNYLEVKP